MTKKKDTKKDKEVRIIEEKCTDFLKYNFTEEEISTMSIDMAQATIRVRQIEERKKAIDSDLKSQIEQAKLEANTLATKIRDGHEYRDIDCKKMLNFDTGRTTIVSLDTGEVVIERKMSSGERQMTITGFEDSSSGDHKFKDPHIREENITADGEAKL